MSDKSLKKGLALVSGSHFSCLNKMGEAWEEKENFFPSVLFNLYFVQLSPYEITSAFLSQSQRNSMDNIYRKQKILFTEIS